MGEQYSSYPSDIDPGTEPEAFSAAFEGMYQVMCGCDTAACDEHELESVKGYIGPLCCNPDFVDVSSLLANDDCTDVQSMDFMEFLASMDEGDATETTTTTGRQRVSRNVAKLGQTLS